MIRLCSFFTLIFYSICGTAALAQPFSGFYSGFDLGYTDAVVRGTEYVDGFPDGWTQKSTPSGALYGLILGYNSPLYGQTILGLELEFEGRSGSGNGFQINPDANMFQCSGACFNVSTAPQYAMSLRPRFGYVINQTRSLLFVTGGYQGGRIKTTFSTLKPAPAYPDNPVGSESISAWHNGWTAGFGIEQFLTKKITGKLEYRYSALNTKPLNAGAIWPGEIEHQRYNENAIRIAFLYHLND